MKVSLNWLKEYVDVSWSTEALVEKLAQLGFPVESVAHSGVQVSNVISVKILSVAKHPNADRLQIAQVTDGSKERTIVCGAPNIAAGQVVPCAVPGAKLPGGIEIVVSKIRGVESQGMLCSERELGLSESHAGILQLAADAPLGKEVKDLFGGADTVLDIEVTPNRPDMLSHIGVARELAAAAGLPLKLPKSDFSAGSQGPECLIQIDEPALCSRYTGKLFGGVQVKPSPDWMARRLKACGIRSINNIVDITNYVLLEWGHPLHAFDLSKLNGHKVIVRKAKKGEKMLALDEKTYALEPSDLVIADAKEPVAIAGIMGGQPTGVSEETTDILLESAVFDRVTVRQTSRRLALRSESSIRFEKGTDTFTAERASVRAAQLILELAGAKAGQAADVYPVKEKTQTILLRKQRLAQVVGVPYEAATVQSILERLDLRPVATADGWHCTAPSHRKDLVEEIDLIEEVVRVVGYDSIPVSASKISLGNISETYRRWDDGPLVETAKGLGLSETLTSSFCSQDALSVFGIDEKSLVALTNPISKEETVLRPLLALNLTRAIQRNLNHQRDTVALFEIGNVFSKEGDRIVERKKIGVAMCGGADIFALKGVIAVMATAFKTEFEFVPAAPAPFLHPYQAFDVLHRKKTVGWAGMLHPAQLQRLGVTHPCALAELDIAAFRSGAADKAQPLPKYPFVQRDIAVVIDKAKTWGEISREVEKNGGSLLAGVSPFDVFEGGSLPAGQKSVAFHVRLQHPDHTLAESEINDVIDKIKSSLQKNCGAQLR